MLQSVSRNIVRRGSPTDNRVYLTFDDGPDPVFTPRILDVLAQRGARACFFVLGSACARFPHLVRDAAAAGHDIGVHGYTHDHPWLQCTAGARAQIRDSVALVADLIGARPRLFRPPYGRLRPAMLAEARQQGLETILWSRSAMDWGRWGRPEKISARLLRTAPGDILLMHDATREQNRCSATLEVLPGFLDWLAIHLLTCGSLSALLHCAPARAPGAAQAADVPGH